MILLFLICLVIAALCFWGFFIFFDDDAGALFIIGVIFLILSMLPTAKTTETVIKNPEITYNTNGVIVAYDGKNYTNSDFAIVDGTKTGKAYPVLFRSFNFYGYEVFDPEVKFIYKAYVSAPPQDTPHE